MYRTTVIRNRIIDGDKHISPIMAHRNQHNMHTRGPAENPTSAKQGFANTRVFLYASAHE